MKLTFGTMAAVTLRGGVEVKVTLPISDLDSFDLVQRQFLSGSVTTGTAALLENTSGSINTASGTAALQWFAR